MSSGLKISAIDQLVDGFISGKLSESDWTHQAHLIVCTHFLSKFEYEDATLRIKIGIIKYNESIGIENTIYSGYHETLTLFWTWVIHSYLKDKSDWSIQDRINGLIDSPFSKKYLPLFFYSEDCLFSKTARVRWVEPDQRELDSASILIDYPSSIWYGDDH